MKTTTAFLRKAAQTPEASLAILGNCRRTDTAETIMDNTTYPTVRETARTRITEIIDAVNLRHYVHEEQVPIHE